MDEVRERSDAERCAQCDVARVVAGASHQLGAAPIAFEQVVAALTVDKNGVRGNEAGFDKNNVATYGIWMEGSGGGDGQTQWSVLTGTNDWTHTNGVWGDKYNYDSKKFQETIAWWKSLQDKGYILING